MAQFKVRIPLHKTTDSHVTTSIPTFVAGMVIDRHAGKVAFKGLLVTASHAVGSARKAIEGVFHTPMWSLGFPTAFFGNVPGESLDIPARQLNSGRGD